MSKWTKRIIIVLPVLFVLSFGVLADDVLAADSGAIARKWVYTQLYNCAKNQFNRTASSGANMEVLGDVVGSKGTLGMPSAGFQGGLPSGTINCQELMTSYAGVQNVSWSDERAADALLKRLRYGPNEVGTKMNVVVDYGYLNTGKYGGDKEGDDYHSDRLEIKITPIVNSDSYNVEGSTQYLTVKSGDSKNSFRICNKKSSNLIDALSLPCTSDIMISDNEKTLQSDIKNAMANANLNHNNYLINFSGGASASKLSVGYVYPSSGLTKSQAAEEVTKEYSGMSLSDLRLSNSELYTLYMQYLKANAKTIACGTSDGQYTAQLKTTDGTFKKCSIDFGGASPASIKVNTQKWGAYPSISSISMASVLAWFNTVDKSTLTDIDDSLVPADGVLELEEEEARKEVPDTGDGAGDVDCQSSGAGKSLGWILCPTLNVLSEAADGAYGLVEDNLRVDKRLFDWNENNGIKDAWTQFQTISNVLFVIFLLVILFSQITGIGLDNYGIKKMLPKLIIAAILVNLSYYICAICVDISNIFGTGLREMFEGFNAGTPTDFITTDGGTLSLGNYAVSGHLISVGLLGALVGGGAIGIFAVLANPMILISLLVSALGIVISIFFLFMMLSLRQAAIVVLIVISPLAFALYLMPNSKGYFDKYIKLFSSLLLLYPMCGLLIGGGNYISRLLMTSGFGEQGVIPAFTAMIVGVAPIFFVPMLLKKSLDAIGGLGGRLSGVGKTVSSGTEKMIRNSGRYKAAQEASLQRRARIYGGLDENGNPSKGWRRSLGNALSGSTKQRQRNALQYQRMIREQGSLKAADEEGFMLKTETDNEMTRIIASGEINAIGELGQNDKGTLVRGLYDALLSGNRAKIRAYTDALSSKGDDGRDAVETAYNSALNAGANNPALKAFSDNIMANHAADYKQNRRSMFEVAKDINGGRAAQTTVDYRNNHLKDLAESITPGSIGSMDDNEFANVFGNGTIPANADKAAVGRVVYQALNGDGAANIKLKRRQQLKRLLNNSGYDPKTDSSIPTVHVA